MAKTKRSIEVDSAPEADLSDLDIIEADERGIIAVSHNYTQKDLGRIAKAKSRSADRPVPLGDYRAEVGTTGLNVFGGRVNQEFLVELRDLKGLRIYEEMRRNDPVIGGLLFSIEMAIRRVHWFAKGKNDTYAEAEDFLEQCREDMSLSWNDFISEVLLMLPFGYAYFEQVYKERKGRTGEPSSKYNDGRIGWRKFGYRPPDTLEKWDVDQNGGIQGMWQRDIYAMRAPVYLPIAKSILFRTRRERNNPEGLSILRNAYRPYFFKKELEKFEAIALERTGAGIPVMKLPLGFTNKDLTLAKQVVRRIRVDEQMGITLPPGWELELMRTNGRAETQTYEMAIDRYANHILMSLLLTFIALGTKSVGSFALVKAQQDFFRLALVGWVSNIAETLNMYAVSTLFTLNANAFPEDIIANPPELQTTDIGEYDLDSIGQFIDRAGRTGFLTPDDHVENYLRRILGLPPLEDPKDSEMERDEFRQAAVGINQMAAPDSQIQGNSSQSPPPAPGSTKSTKVVNHPYGNPNANTSNGVQAKKNGAVKKAVNNERALRNKYRELAISGVSKTSEYDLAMIRGLIEEVLQDFEQVESAKKDIRREIQDVED